MKNENQNNYRDTGVKVLIKGGYCDGSVIGVMGMLSNGVNIMFYDAGNNRTTKSEWDGETFATRDVVETKIQELYAMKVWKARVANSAKAQRGESTRNSGADLEFLIDRFREDKAEGKDTRPILNTVIMLCQNGADVNFDEVGSGFTQLIAAVYEDSPALVAALLDAGAFVVTKGYNALEALDHAHDCLKKHTDEIRAMLEVANAEQQPLLAA